MLYQEEKTTNNTNLSSVSAKLLPPSENKYICCFSEKWWFKHQGVPLNKEYDETDCLCFQFLDCCSWCLEFKQKRNCLCRQRTFCFLCCCTITFV